MIVLGVDPGSASTGFGLIRAVGGRLIRIHSGEIRPPRNAPFPEKLQVVYRGVRDLLDREAVDEAAVEDLFQGVNPRTVARIGLVRGVVLLAAADSSVSIAEYPPARIKSAVTGNGQATKEQVRYMVRSILDLADLSGSTDESDALAVAICHCHRVAREGAR
ncbi:MAG: crossover junction endodeoxyribonuclease RuvC [Candidatus Eisenbacteria bacterium]|nr:crossover junction endodeoxyribonuclease RuvC [Candidatus Eisenbacteria bacterium]